MALYNVQINGRSYEADVDADTPLSGFCEIISDWLVPNMAVASRSAAHVLFT